ncbi:MAG: hypothetical protein KAS32_19030 [Candidatus Peribacteraceae bacterium]|nr:hypothetical protein [Candidatus Peribacteraceae bacterium]
MSVHWSKVTEGSRGVDWNEFLEKIRKLPSKQLWRHNQAGDLPGLNGTIDRDMMVDLIFASKGTRPFTYTHKYHGDNNRRLIKYANESGFAINLSADNLKEAAELFELGIGPVVVVLPDTARKLTRTIAGIKVITCPAFFDDDKSCAVCGLCRNTERKFIIGFPAHGAKSQYIYGNDRPKLF